MKNILITGTSGYVGAELLRKLLKVKADDQTIDNIVALDIASPIEKIEGVNYCEKDIRDESLKDIFQDYKINTVIHLACILNPSERINKDVMFDINVNGTRNIINCLKIFNVERFIFASSGAAYGYYKESLNWLTESSPIRGNVEFPYSYHKRINEEDLIDLHKSHPMIKKFTFRISTVLGKNVNNPITDLFKKSFILGVKETDAPFVFIWDEDLVNILVSSVFSDKPGVYNVAGDGAVKMSEIAKCLNKKYVKVPSIVLESGLRVLNCFRLSQYGPEQVKFLKFRPVLLNESLKKDFGYIPAKNSKETFEFFLKESNH